MTAGLFAGLHYEATHEFYVFVYPLGDVETQIPDE